MTPFDDEENQQLTFALNHWSKEKGNGLEVAAIVMRIINKLNTMAAEPPAKKSAKKD